MHPVDPTTNNLGWPPAGWLTKSDAAKRLGLSESRVAAMIGRGINTLETRSPISNQKVKLLHAGDIERTIFERDHPSEVPKLPAKMPETLGMGVPNRSSMTEFPIMRAQDLREMIGPQHISEHYRIVEWTKPSEDSPHFKFRIVGPDGEGVYIALSETCGPDLVKRLEAAFQAGLKTGNARNRNLGLRSCRRRRFRGFRRSRLSG